MPSLIEQQEQESGAELIHPLIPRPTLHLLLDWSLFFPHNLHNMSRSTPTQNTAASYRPPKAHDIWEMAMIADSFPTSPKMFQCRRNADEGKGGGREGPRPDKVSLMTSAARNNRNDVVSASR